MFHSSITGAIEAEHQWILIALHQLRFCLMPHSFLYAFLTSVALAAETSATKMM